MTVTRDPQAIIRIVILLAGLIVILAGVKMSSSIIGPLLLGLFCAILFGMLMLWLEAKGVPHLLALLVAIVSFLAVVAGFFILIAASFYQLIGALPRYQEDIERTLGPLLSQAGVSLPPSSIDFSRVYEFFITGFSGIASSLVSVALVVIATLFLLVEAKGFMIKIRAILADQPDILGHLISLAGKLVSYIVIRTEINLVTGASIGLIIAAVGLEYAVFWGFIAFALSFIPYLGFILAVIPPTLIAWSVLGPVDAIIIFAGAVIINMIAENILFPEAAGKGLNVSPAVVFISLVFWGYVIGSLGALLAVPLTLALMMFLMLFDETRWIGLLLSPADFAEPDREPGKPEGGGPGPAGPE
jgi:predicted PurR-regulated permease PerM